jgi:hypothetical protein
MASLTSRSAADRAAASVVALRQSVEEDDRVKAKIEADDARRIAGRAERDRLARETPEVKARALGEELVGDLQAPLDQALEAYSEQLTPAAAVPVIEVCTPFIPRCRDEVGEELDLGPLLIASACRVEISQNPVAVNVFGVSWAGLAEVGQAAANAIRSGRPVYANAELQRLVDAVARRAAGARGPVNEEAAARFKVMASQAIARHRAVALDAFEKDLEQKHRGEFAAQWDRHVSEIRAVRAGGPVPPGKDGAWRSAVFQLGETVFGKVERALAAVTSPPQPEADAAEEK